MRDPARPRRGRRWLLREVLLVLLLPVISPFPPPGAAADPAGAVSRLCQFREGKGPSIRCRPDPVIIEGSRLPCLCGRKIDDIRVYVFKDGSLRPIPFQVDEQDADGNLVLPGGPKATRDSDPLFDGNDLILFMAHDLGKPAPAPVTPGTGGACAEARVTDPLDGSHGYVYLGLANSPPPRNERAYVRYTIKEGLLDNVDAQHYCIHYPWGEYYSDTWFVPAASGGCGVDFLDRLKARGTFQCFFSLVKVRITEDRMGSRVIAYLDGPIRVVRRVSYWAKLGLGIRSPSFQADITYYPSFVQAPVTVRVPASLDLFFSKAYGEIGTDYTHEAYGMLFKNSRNREGTIIDGRMSPQENALDLAMDEWRLVTGPQGTFFRGRIPDNPMMHKVAMSLRYVDDIRKPDPPEGEPGQVGHIYDRIDVLAMDPGTFRIGVTFSIPPYYRPGDEEIYLAWEANPLRVDVAEGP